MHRPRQRAFTLIEILVVIGIIVILVGLLTVGLKMLSGSGGKTSTLTTMESMVAISNDLLTRQVPGGNIALNTSHPLFGSGSYTIAPEDLAADAPSAIWFTTGTVASPVADRFASSGVLATAALLNQAQAVPDLQSIFNNLPQSQMLAISTPGNVWLQNWTYQSGDVVGYVTHDYTGTETNTMQWYQATGPASSPPPGSGWGAPTTTPNPVSSRVVLDAWHNPMIYVPPGGLRGVIPSIATVYNGGATYSAGTVVKQQLGTGQWVAYTFVAIAPGNGALPVWPATSVPPWQEYIVTSSDGRGFWASAGPDGKMTAGDDNVYSFQK